MVSRNVKPAKPVGVVHSSNISLGSLLLRFTVSMGSTIGFIWLVLSIGGWIFGWQLLAHTGFLGASLVVVLCAFLSILYVFVYLFVELQKSPSFYERKENVDEKGDKQLTDTLMADLEAAYHEGRWEEVLKIGGVLSRPLWVTGKYKLRVRLGKLVEAAAAYSDRPIQQATALIDDLGWTKFALGEVEEAKRNILHGIGIANEAGSKYLAYKGYRHLSGIALENGSLNEAIEFHNRAEEFANQLLDGVAKQEALAGLQHNKALIEMKRRNWVDALREFQVAQKLYRDAGDNERYVKQYPLMGEVLYEMGRFGEAKDVFREGLSASRQESRKDGILQNNLGIAKIALHEGDIEEARRAYKEGAKIAHELGREALARELETKATTLHANMS